MMPACKSRWRETLMYAYLQRMLRRSFHDVRLRGQSHLDALDPSRPILAISNHISWWDGLMIFRLTRVLHQLDFYCMMEEKQLRPNRFFTWIGAFGVNLDDRREAAASVRYALELLQRPAALVWVFPQGEIVSPHTPIQIKPGASFLARKCPEIQILPLAFRYEFFRDDRPHALIEAGQPFDGNDCDDTAIETALSKVSASLDQAVRDQTSQGFELLQKPQLPINKKWEWVQLALKGRLNEFKQRN